jgi:hypothetical protein
MPPYALPGTTGPALDLRVGGNSGPFGSCTNRNSESRFGSRSSEHSFGGHGPEQESHAATPSARRETRRMHRAASGRTDREVGAGRRAALRGPSLRHAAQEEASEAGRPPPQLAQGNPRLWLLQLLQLLQPCTCPVVTGTRSGACMAHVADTCGAACGSGPVHHAWEGEESLGGVGHGRGSSPPVRRQSWRYGVLSTRRPCAGGPEGPWEVAREACGYESSRGA